MHTVWFDLNNSNMNLLMLDGSVVKNVHNYASIAALLDYNLDKKWPHSLYSTKIIKIIYSLSNL